MDVQTRRTELGRIRKKKQRNLMRRKARRVKHPKQPKRKPTTTLKPSKVMPIPHSPSSPATSPSAKESLGMFRNTYTTLSDNLQKERNQSMYVAPQVAIQVAAQVPNATTTPTMNVTHQHQPDSILQEYDILHDFTAVLMEEYDVLDRFADDILSPSAITCC